eukprot:10634074-Lingulodinium_polyedra.AAC.1
MHPVRVRQKCVARLGAVGEQLGNSWEARVPTIVRHRRHSLFKRRARARVASVGKEAETYASSKDARALAPDAGT